MRISTIMSRMEDLLTKIQSGNIPKEDRDLLEVLILTGLVRKNNSTYEITEKGLEFLDKPVMEN
jgi:predicted transcriptional regulator